MYFNLLQFRNNVINQSTGSLVLDVKYHYDDMVSVLHSVNTLLIIIIEIKVLKYSFL